MPLVVGGHPEWVWERTPNPLRCEISESRSHEGHIVFEVTVRCGLEIMRLHFLTREELQSFHRLLGEQFDNPKCESRMANGREDAVDEAVDESFPASDAPSRTPIHGTGPAAARSRRPATREEQRL